MGCHKSSSQRDVHSNTGLSQIYNLTYHPKELENGEQTKPKVSRRKEIIKIREEINEKELQKKKKKKTTDKINKTKSWFFERVNKIDKALASFTKKMRERTQIQKIRNEQVEISMDTAEIYIYIKETTMNNYMPTNLITQKKQTTFQRHTAHQNRIKKKQINWTDWSLEMKLNM